MSARITGTEAASLSRSGVRYRSIATHEAADPGLIVPVLTFGTAAGEGPARGSGAIGDLPDNVAGTKNPDCLLDHPGLLSCVRTTMHATAHPRIGEDTHTGTYYKDRRDGQLRRTPSRPGCPRCGFPEVADIRYRQASRGTYRSPLITAGLHAEGEHRSRAGHKATKRPPQRLTRELRRFEVSTLPQVPGRTTASGRIWPGWRSI